MSVTFLVAINTEQLDPNSLLFLAEDIEDDLVQAGHDVDSVKPWARSNNPIAQPSGGFSPVA